LVAGIWVGYDDFRPMPGITGGSLPAQTWHSFMSVAHNGYHNIPPIPGLAPHPNQVEQARSSESKRPEAASAQMPSQPPQPEQKKSSLMSDQTRETLRRLAQSMRRAAGLEPTPAAAPATAPKPKPAEPKAKPAVPERRAEVPADRSARP
jgi:penicillin-binding protein 1A